MSMTIEEEEEEREAAGHLLPLSTSETQEPRLRRRDVILLGSTRFSPLRHRLLATKLCQN